jgi:hypothetical protein
MTPGDIPERERHRFAPILARLEAGAAEHFGVAGARVTPVGYEERPFSWLARAAVANTTAPATPLGHVFIKIFKPKDPASAVDMRARVIHDYATTCDIHTFMRQWDDLGAVRPIACYDDALTIVTEQAEGVTLLDALRAEAAWFPWRAQREHLSRSLETVGRWLKRFQGFRPGGGHVAVDALVDYVDTRLRRMVEKGVMEPGDRQRILDHLSALGRIIPSDDLKEVSVHADLAPANVLVSERGVVVLDFAMAGRGTALHDISRLHMQLDLLRAKPHFRRGVVEPLQAALLRGFDPALDASRPLFRFLSMLHRVNHLGTLALRKESLPGRLVSGRAIGMHRAWIEAELKAGAR